MTDHHDFGDHHYDDQHGFDDVQHDPFEHDPGLAADDHDHVSWDEPVEHHDEPDLAHLGHDDAVGHDDPAETPAEVHADLPDDTPVDVFPPAVEVGELPEPVDGFPWIDSGSLGLADIQAALHEATVHDSDGTDPVQPAELAEYAGTDLPPGVDPWAALADSDDPATAALAKWWSQN
jgi:hypothetical protein